MSIKTQQTAEIMIDYKKVLASKAMFLILYKKNEKKTADKPKGNVKYFFFICKMILFDMFLFIIYKIFFVMLLLKIKLQMFVMLFLYMLFNMNTAFILYMLKCILYNLNC